jgi:hypothetical protein
MNRIYEYVANVHKGRTVLPYVILRISRRPRVEYNEVIPRLKKGYAKSEIW